MKKKGPLFPATLNGDIDWGADQNALECPFCGETYLHHKEVRIYYRRVEDGATYIKQIKDHASGFMVTEDDETNPSRRRDAIGIRFNCEGCHCGVFREDGHETKPPIELCIVQHKGMTYVYWRLWKDLEADTPQNVVPIKRFDE